MTVRRILLAAAGLAVAGALAAQTPSPQPAPQDPPAKAQKAPRRNPIPDTFTNLQVLPKDTSKPQLVAVMRSLSITFGKRCSFCHVATDDLSEADFPSDAKETKAKAREMLRLIREAGSKPATP